MRIDALDIALPERVVTNDQLEEQYPEWDFSRLTHRTGVNSRHIADEHETAYDFALKAAQNLVTNQELDPQSIDALVFCTQSPDYLVPGSAAILQSDLGMRSDIFTLDVNIGCSAFPTLLQIAEGLCEGRVAANVLIVTADTYSKYIHPEDRSTRILFGDGAVATLVSKRNEERKYQAIFGVRGDLHERFWIRNGGARHPKSNASDTSELRSNFIQMSGMKVLSFFNTQLPREVARLLDVNDLLVEKIDAFVFHQASRAALDSIQQAIRIPEQKMIRAYSDVGNLVSASVPATLYFAMQDGRIKEGDLLLICGFGVGLSWGATAMTTSDSEVIDVLLERFKGAGDKPALVFREKLYSFSELVYRIEQAEETIHRSGIGQGDTVLLVADFSVHSVVLLISLIRMKAIIVPILPDTFERRQPLLNQIDPRYIINIANDTEYQITPWEYEHEADPLIKELRRRKSTGLVLFTSGSTGQPKGVVHDFSLLLEKFRIIRPALVTLNFLLFDHWGGLNTLLHGLSNQSLVILPERRTPDYICHLLENYDVELLPATPTFLNMLLISKVWKERTFPALRIISYGAEPMPGTTLAALRKAFPEVELRQTYGLIELGVLRAKSRDSDSLWVKLGGKGYDLRVVDNMLQIKAESAMLGYINAPSPFTDDGYFMTGDQVEVDGEYFRILGRASDLINVGGEKVYPLEVEAVLISCENIKDAVVYGEHHSLMGKIVCADVILVNDEPEQEVRKRIKRECRTRLDAFKVPVKINVVQDGLYTDRMKKARTR